MRRFIGFIALWLFSPAVPVWASCGASSCPVDCSSWERTREGSVRVDVQFEYSEQDQLRIGTRDAAFREIRGHHDEEFTVNRIHRLGVSVGLTDRLSADLRLPVISRSHAHIHRHHGEDILEAWDIGGVGDLSLLARYAFWKPENRRDPTLSLILGGEFPTGRHHKKNGEGDEAEPGIQPGSNSLDFIAGLSSIQTFEAPMVNGQMGTFPLFASFTAQFNGPGNEEYRIGDTFQFNVGTSYPALPWLGVLTQFNFLVRDRDGKGRTGEEIQKTGGEVLYFSPGVEIKPTDDWRAFGLIQIPIYERVNLIQTVSDYNVVAGISYRFDAWGKSKAEK
ncbi:MAG: transporter [Candidatus Omnitrophica bacterium]|nr:transporter [Candidatus Omnitrophota bacterium]